jgi:lipopolysaccharide/colanic/teichoic acid biosynthesis glycosyltransferase
LYIHNRLSYELGFTFDLISDDSHSFLTLQDEPLEDPVNRGLKRLFDLVFAAGVIVTLLLPLAAVVAVMQRLQSPGPLFYAQTRTGLNRAAFRIYKFRTMHVANPAPDRPAAPGDDRIFPCGRFLRRSSLDELPQFWNVLRGEMSLVGPRPLPVYEVEKFSAAAQRRRLSVKPGLTCLWQVSGRNKIKNFDEWVELDLRYIDNWSLWLDISILLRTLPAVIMGAGAK